MGEFQSLFELTKQQTVTTWVVFVGVSAVWRLAPVAWRFGPTQVCQGVG